MKITATSLAWLILTVLLSGCGGPPYGTGLPENYDGLTKSQITARLPSDSLVLLDASSDIAAPWPARLRDVADVDTVERGRIHSLTWWMSMDGARWQRFYSFALDVYLKEHKLEPAMIYERRPTSGGTAFVPVMSLFFNQSGQATKSSKTWCEVVRKKAIEKEETSNQALHGD